MKYLVDPQLVIDVLENSRKLSESAAALFARHRRDELVLAPTSYLALSASFMGIRSNREWLPD